MTSPRQLLQHQSNLVGLIYACAVEPERIPDLLRSLSTALDGTCAQLYTIHSLTSSVIDSHISESKPEMQQANSEYVRKWHALDPRAKLLAALPMGDVLKCHEHFDEKLVAGSSFFQEFLIPSGFRWAIAGMFPTGAGTATAVSVLRAVGQPHFEDWAANTLRQLLPHFERAWMIAGMVQHQAAAIRSAEELLKTLPIPCLFTDEAGRSIQGNPAFEHSAERLSLRIVTGRVRFEDPEIQHRWEVALWETHATGLGRTLDVAAPSGLWSIQLQPCDPLVAHGNVSNRQMIAAVFEERSAVGHAAADVAVSKARLTRAELEVLAGLLKGLPAKTIAGHRGASVNTVRSQIMAILEKMGFRSQKELIASFGSSALPDSAYASSTFHS